MLVAKEKKVLRKKLLEKLLSLSSMEVERRSRNVEKTIRRLSEYIDAERIMVYYPLKGEVSILGLMRKFLGKKQICFPLISDRELVPYRVVDMERELSMGVLGVRQPCPEKTEKINVKDLDLVILPGLAFDYEGYRLGRGAGFYDRLLKRLPEKTKTLGVAFDFQIFDNLPHQPSCDEPVDIMVTDTDVFYL